MIEITLTGVQWRIADAGTLKIIQLQDPSGIVVNVPFEPEAARKLAAGLNGIELATILPPNGRPAPK